MWNSGSYRWRKGHSGLYLPGGFPVGPTLWPGTDYAGSQIYPSVMNLVAHRNLTINSITQGPDFIYLGSQATTSAWPAYQVGSDLTAAGAGADVVPDQGSPFYDSLDGGVKTSYAGKGFQKAATYPVETEDLIIEAVVMFPNCATNDYQRICMQNSAAPFYDMLFNNSSGNTYPQLSLDDNASHTADINGATLTPYTVNYLIWFVDRSGSGICYSNGAAGSAVDVSAVGSLTNGGSFTLINSDALDRGLTTPLYYLAMWKRASWLDTHLQADLAKQRSQMLWGMYPKYSKGASLAEVL